MEGTALFGNEEGVDTAETTEDGDDADSLVLYAHQVSGDGKGEVKGDGVEQGHACEQPLEESSALVHLLLQTHEQHLHLRLERVSRELWFFGLLLG